MSNYTVYSLRTPSNKVYVGATSMNVIRRWNNGKKAQQYTGIQASHISKVCKQERATAGGYIWKYSN